MATAGIHERLKENGTLVPLADMQRWLHEILWRCGGLRAAARTLGVSHTMLHRWVWQSESVQAVYIRKHNAETILKTLAQLRLGLIQPDKRVSGPPKGRPKAMSQEEWLQTRHGCETP